MKIKIYKPSEKVLVDPGGGGVLPKILGRGVLPRVLNPDPI